MPRSRPRITYWTAGCLLALLFSLSACLSDSPTLKPTAPVATAPAAATVMPTRPALQTLASGGYPGPTAPAARPTGAALVGSTPYPAPSLAAGQPNPDPGLVLQPGSASAGQVYAIALAQARAWQTDAYLSRLETAEPGGLDGLAPAWSLLFNSPSRRLENLSLQVKDGQIVYSHVTDASGLGRPIQDGWLDSSAAALQTTQVCAAAPAGSFLFSLQTNAQGGQEWVVSCGSAGNVQSVRLNAVSGEVIKSWSGGRDAEP